MTYLTPVVDYGGWCAKREDLAGFTDPAMPSGAKVRQYGRMIAGQDAGLPLVVGCAAASAMQVYVAAAALAHGREAVVVVPRRKVRTPSTVWAAAHGATIVETAPGYMTVVRARARAERDRIGGAVRWDMTLAATDTAAQVTNLPPCRRVIVPTGSGLTAAGVIAGMVDTGREGVVVAVTVSPMADAHGIWAQAAGFLGCQREAATAAGVTLEVIPPAGRYDAPHHGAALPEPAAMPLDAYYAAKAFHYVTAGDVFWVPGRRPLEAC